MFNPYENTRTLNKALLHDITEAIEVQKGLALTLNPKWHIAEVSSIGNYYNIAFCLRDYKNNDFALFWEIQVKKDDLLSFVAENYEDVPEYYLEDYFLDNDMKISLEWLNEQDLEELEFVKIVA